MWLLVGASALAAAVGCDVGAPDLEDPSRSFNRPTVDLGVVAATTGYDALGQPIHTPLLEGQTTAGVATSASVRLFFNRFLLPTSVIRQAVCLRPLGGTGGDEVANAEACTAPNQIFTEPQYDPVTREVIYRLPPGARLEADTVYRLTVFRELDEQRPGLRAFDGAALTRSYAFDFRTQPAGGAERDEPRPSPEAYCASVKCFDACDQVYLDCLGPCADDLICQSTCGDERDTCSTACEPLCVLPRDVCAATRGRYHFNPQSGLFKGCTSVGCHSQANPDGLSNNLDLSTEPSVFDTAVGKTSHQTQTGQEAVSGDLNPLRFGRAMPLIDPGNPGNSYLLYKLVINPFNHYNQNGVLEPQLDASIQRLRKTVVVGLPMPAETAGGAIGLEPATTDPDGSQSFARMRLLSSWIAHGAVLSCD